MRVLAARGVVLGRRISAKGLRVYSAYGRNGPRLLFRGGIAGPSWPAIATLLEECGIEYSILVVGRIWLLTSDSETTRTFTRELHQHVKQSASELVLVPDVGFVSVGVKKKFELRTLIGPAVVAILSFGLALVPIVLQQEESPQEPEKLQVSCVLDLPVNQIKVWVSESISGRELGSPSKILVSSELGELALEVLETLGSTQSVTGLVQCSDGRSKQLHYRIDSSASGGLVELGQKLDP